MLYARVFYRKSIQSLLNQDYDNLKIIISDDCSSDNTYHLISSMISQYDGPHDVVINRNKNNLGIGRHFDLLMTQFAEGELVVACAGDDISKENRVSRVVEEWLRENKPALVAHSLEEIDENDKVFVDLRTIQYKEQNHSLFINSKFGLYNYLQYQIPTPYVGAALSYNLELYLKFKEFKVYPDFEDHLMIFRALLVDRVFYFTDVLVKYRRHKGSFTRSNPVLVNTPKKFKVENFLDFRRFQISIQRWLDYQYAFNKKWINIEYYIVAELWEEMLSRGSNIVSNNSENISLDYIEPYKTVLYGVGDREKRALSKITAGFDIIYSCVLNEELQRGFFCGLEIISPKKLAEKIESIDCILVPSSHYHYIKNIFFEKFNIPKNKIVRLSDSITR